MTIKLKIGEKLALILIGFTFIATVFLTASYYLQTENALRDRVFLQLSSIKQLKKVKIMNDLNDHLTSFNQLKYDSLDKPPKDFILIARDTVMPKIVGDYLLPSNLEIDESVRVIDVTSQNAKAGITIVFISKHKHEIVTALVRLPDVQDILFERTGLGETGESYLVNADRWLITKSRSANWDKIKVETRGVNQAFQGISGTGAFMDYRNMRVLGAFEKIEFKQLEWVLLSEINFNEAMDPLDKLRNSLLYIFIVIFMFILIVSYYLSRLVVKPVVTMEKRLIRLSEGILEIEPSPVKNNHDEIGHMFIALNKLIVALEQTVIFAREIGSGNFEAKYEPLSTHDKLGETLLQMKFQLQEFKINEFRLMRENQMSFLEGQEKERIRLSKELHDGIGPFLTTLKMKIQSEKLDKKFKSDLLDRLDDTIDEVRRVSNNLMPSVLVDFGVGEAINNLVEQFAAPNLINIKYKNDMFVNSSVEMAVQITLYRITQEAISNILKHSNCTEIKISISEFEEYVGLFIYDNGDGFDTSQKFSGNGIRNMKERVILVNGNINISSSKTGTTIDIEIPLNEHN